MITTRNLPGGESLQRSLFHHLVASPVQTRPHPRSHFALVRVAIQTQPNPAVAIHPARAWWRGCGSGPSARAPAHTFTHTCTPHTQHRRDGRRRPITCPRPWAVLAKRSAKPNAEGRGKPPRAPAHAPGHRVPQLITRFIKRTDLPSSDLLHIYGQSCFPTTLFPCPTHATAHLWSFSPTSPWVADLISASPWLIAVHCWHSLRLDSDNPQSLSSCHTIYQHHHRPQPPLRSTEGGRIPVGGRRRQAPPTESAITATVPECGCRPSLGVPEDSRGQKWLDGSEYSIDNATLQRVTHLYSVSLVLLLNFFSFFSRFLFSGDPKLSDSSFVTVQNAHTALDPGTQLPEGRIASDGLIHPYSLFLSCSLLQ